MGEIDTATPCETETGRFIPSVFPVQVADANADIMIKLHTQELELSINSPPPFPLNHRLSSRGPLSESRSTTSEKRPYEAQEHLTRVKCL